MIGVQLLLAMKSYISKIILNIIYLSDFIMQFVIISQNEDNLIIISSHYRRELVDEYLHGSIAVSRFGKSSNGHILLSKCRLS